MTNLVRWCSVPDTTNRPDEFELLFDDTFSAPTLLEIPLNWRPALDLLESEDSFVIRADMPNVEPEALEISLDNNVLTICGETKGEEAKSGEQYRLRERHFGRFSRSVTLPASVNPKAVEACYEQGTLNILIAKVSKSKPRHIPVRFNTPRPEIIKGL
jgi:HSP20 family protein